MDQCPCEVGASTPAVNRLPPTHAIRNSTCDQNEHSVLWANRWVGRCEEVVCEVGRCGGVRCCVGWGRLMLGDVWWSVIIIIIIITTTTIIIIIKFLFIQNTR